MLNFFEKYLSISFAIIVACALPKISFSQVQIDSIKTTVSTCQSNGSITVFAKSTAAVLYSITAGPLIKPGQTANIFNNLPPGNYTIEVSDGSGNPSQNVTVTGTYARLNFNPVTTSPYCVGNSDGKIIGNNVTGTGNGPFTWQLVAPSVITSLPQASDTFNNLPAGNYTLNLTDACGMDTTIVVTIAAPNTKSGFSFDGNFIEIIGCDSAWVTSVILVPTATLRLPLSFSYHTKYGTYIPATGTTLIDTTYMRYSGLVYLQQLLPGITYGDSVTTTIYNSCGDSIVYPNAVDPYTFYSSYSYSNCGTSATAHFNYVPQASVLYGLKAPVSYMLVDTATNIVTDSGVLKANPTHYYGSMIFGIPIKPTLVVGQTYKLTVTDGCGKVFKQDYTIPVQPLAKRDSINEAICPGESYEFNGQAYTQPGIYRDTLATATCDSVVTLNLTILSDPPINITASSYNVLKGHTIHLDATPSLSYLWTATGAILSDDTIQNPSAVINDSSWIYLKTTSNVGECISTDSVFIAISEVNAGSLPTDTLPTSTNDTVTCDGSYIYMPNAFTPNGDGLNDVFKIYGKNIAINRFEIFNRQGEMVFETNDVNTGWDGSYKGATTTGTYVYLIYYYSVCDAKIKMLTGDVVLIR